MKITITKKLDDKTDILVCFFTEGVKKTHSTSIHHDFSGKQDESLLLYNDKAKRVLFLGLGKSTEVTAEKIRRASSIAADKTKSLKLNKLTIEVPNLLTTDNVTRAIVSGVILGNYSYNKYITDKENKKNTISSLTLVGTAKMNVISDEQKICENTLLARDLVNENAADKYPEKLATLMKKLARKNKINCTIIDEKQMKKLGMGLILGVNAGSSKPARLVILEYSGDRKQGSSPIALVGKGIIFDSGGLNLKPTNYIESMRQDMGGAATVFATIIAAAQLKLQKNIIAVMPLTDNMPGSAAQKPGDVVRSYSGLNVEIGNTDAEGRLVLGDAVYYTLQKYKPQTLIDLATLTGAVIVALGDSVAGVLGNNNKLINKLIKAGEKTNERVWQLPLFDEHKDDVKSEIADVKNIGYPRQSGTMSGAAFVEKFVTASKHKVNWAHIDIAGTAFMERQRYYLKKGGTGFGVRLLIEYLRDN